MKTRKSSIRRSIQEFRQKEKTTLLDKYFDLFCASFKIEGDLTEQDKDYLKRQFYYRGSTCITQRVDGQPLLCPYAPSSWNNEDYPVNIQYINKRGLPGIFPKSMTGVNMVDCVIGYIRPSKRSIYDYVEHQVNKIVELAITIKVNELTQRLPLLVGVSPSDRASTENIIEELAQGELAIFCNLNDIDRFKTFPGATFNIDKLRAEKEAVENELKTQLGINNNNNIKKERMIVDEVNANNDEIATSSNVYLTPLEAFTKSVKEVLGFNITINWEGELDKQSEEEGEENGLE